MALVRKENTPLEVKGLSIQSAYLVIDDFAKYDKVERKAIYYVDVYSASSQRSDRKNIIIKRATESCSGDDFDTYFGVRAINPLGENPIKKAYQHILTIDVTIGEGDESVTQKKYKDWESDE